MGLTGGRTPSAARAPIPLAAGPTPAEEGPKMSVASRVAEGEAPAESDASQGPDASGVHPADGRDGPDAERRESGMAPARERLVSEITLTARGDELVQLALAESTRTEANLNLLLRGLQHLTAGASAALEANTQMACELDAVRDLLGKSQVEELALRQKVRLLEHSLENLRRETARERSFFIEQEDLFLVELLGDHEREIACLKERLAEATRREPRRDPGAEARSTIRPEPIEHAETTPLGAVALRTIRIPRPTPVPAPDTLHPGVPHHPPSQPWSQENASTAAHERDTAPPGAVAAAELQTERPPEDPAARDQAVLLTRPTSRPPLMQKPDLSTRPLVGYSLGNGEVAEEHLEVARGAARKPEG
jgi:hypothetical protein